MKILVNPWSSWSFRKKRSISLCQLTSSIIIRCCLGLQRCGTWYLGYGRPTSGIIGMSRLQWIDDHLLLRENKQCFGHAHIVSLSSYPAKIIFNMITYIYNYIYIYVILMCLRKKTGHPEDPRSQSLTILTTHGFQMFPTKQWDENPLAATPLPPWYVGPLALQCFLWPSQRRSRTSWSLTRKVSETQCTLKHAVTNGTWTITFVTGSSRIFGGLHVFCQIARDILCQ